VQGRIADNFMLGAPGLIDPTGAAHQLRRKAADSKVAEMVLKAIRAF